LYCPAATAASVGLTSGFLVVWQVDLCARKQAACCAAANGARVRAEIPLPGITCWEGLQLASTGMILALAVTHTRMHVHAHARTRTHTHTHTHTRTHARTHAHKHTHTHTQGSAPATRWATAAQPAAPASAAPRATRPATMPTGRAWVISEWWIMSATYSLRLRSRLRRRGALPRQGMDGRPLQRKLSRQELGQGIRSWRPQQRKTKRRRRTGSCERL
jgi:hypothetical protein